MEQQKEEQKGKQNGEQNSAVILDEAVYLL